MTIYLFFLIFPILDKPPPAEVRPPGHVAFPATVWSITISATKGDVDRAILPVLHQFLKDFCLRDGFATEVGSRAFRFHIQGLIEIRCPTTAEYKVFTLLTLQFFLQFFYFIIARFLQKENIVEAGEKPVGPSKWIWF